MKPSYSWISPVNYITFNGEMMDLKKKTVLCTFMTFILIGAVFMAGCTDDEKKKPMDTGADTFGPFLSSDGLPMNGLDVVFYDEENNTYGGQLDENGTLILEEALESGEYRCEILANGSVIIPSFELEITDKGDVKYGEDEEVPKANQTLEEINRILEDDGGDDGGDDGNVEPEEFDPTVIPAFNDLNLMNQEPIDSQGQFNPDGEGMPEMYQDIEAQQDENDVDVQGEFDEDKDGEPEHDEEIDNYQPMDFDPLLEDNGTRDATRGESNLTKFSTEE